MQHIDPRFIYLGVAAAGLLFLFWLPTRLRYRVTPRHVQVRLFGVPIRRVRLDNIKYISTVRVFLAEKWQNTWFPGHHRCLIIHRRTGLIKNFVITPTHRYVFKSEIDRARQALGLDHTRPPGNTEFLERNKTAAESGLKAGGHFAGPGRPAH